MTAFGINPEASGHQHVSDFVGSDASQHDSNQRQVTRPVGWMVRVVFRPENKQRQDQEREVKPNLNSEQTPDVNRPASHNLGCYSYFTWSAILAPALEGTEPCA